jgi:hypothetical protein
VLSQLSYAPVVSRSGRFLSLPGADVKQLITTPDARTPNFVPRLRFLRPLLATAIVLLIVGCPTGNDDDVEDDDPDGDDSASGDNDATPN